MYYINNTNILVPKYPNKFNNNCWSILFSGPTCIVYYLNENNELLNYRVKLGNIISTKIKIELYAKGIDYIQKKLENKEIIFQRHNKNAEYFVIIYQQKIVYSDYIMNLLE